MQIDLDTVLSNIPSTYAVGRDQIVNRLGHDPGPDLESVLGALLTAGHIVQETSGYRLKEPDNLGGDLRFWRSSFVIQLKLGKPVLEAKQHADAYIAELRRVEVERPL